MDESEPVDLSEFDALRPSRTGPCVVKRAPEALSKEDVKKFLAALEMGYSNRIMAQWLTEHGLKTSESSIWKHRRGLCTCE